MTEHINVLELYLAPHKFLLFLTLHKGTLCQQVENIFLVHTEVREFLCDSNTVVFATFA